ncbi:hypothetical protein AGMMS50230_17180 [Spirochaetia bacterium]|nr:hypothetical protein AGMMS50230_17180 [Spirochaetia bacterium]
MTRCKLKAFFVVCTLAAIPLCAQEEIPGTTVFLSGPITSIEVIGLKRTKPHVARYPLEQFLGREGADLNLNEVEAAVRNTGILEPVLVELAKAADSGADGGLALRVTVEEKWSIFPVPLVMAGSGETSFGLFLADTNAFGLRDQAVLGGIYGSSGWRAMAMYNLTADRRGLPDFTSLVMYNRRERKDSDREKRIYRQYTADELRLSLGLQYPFTRHLSGSITTSFTSISLARNDPPQVSTLVEIPERGAKLLALGPVLTLRYSTWDGFLLSQQSLSLRYSYSFALEGTSLQTVEFQGVYEQSLTPGFRLFVRSGALWKTGEDPLMEEGPQKAQVDILPRQFSARQYAGFSAGLEKYLFKAKYGTLSVLGAWQGVFSRGPISGTEFDHGPSGGIRFYLSRLALPALGAGVAYNMNSGLFQFTFSLGMGF